MSPSWPPHAPPRACAKTPLRRMLTFDAVRMTPGGVSRRGRRVRSLWQTPVLRYAAEPPPPPHQAALEPEHPAGAGGGQRRAAPLAGVHLVPARRQGHEATPSVGHARFV